MDIPNEKLGISKEKLGISKEKLGIPNEKLGIPNEKLGISKEKLEVYSYHWEIKKELVTSNECDKIYAWCLDQNSNPYLLRFEDKITLFHLKLPEIVDNNRIEWEYNYRKVIDFIIYKIKTHRTQENRSAKIISYEFNYKQLLYLYEGNKKYPILTLYFNNSANAYVVANFFKKEVGIKGIGQESLKTGFYGKQYRGYPEAKYECLELGINIVRRMLTIYNTEFCQWFSTLGIKPELDQKVSFLEKEYIIKDPIKPLPYETTKEWKGNPRVFTFDIETMADNDFEFPNEIFYGQGIFSISCMIQKYQELKSRRVINLIVANSATCTPGEEIRCYRTEKELLTDFYNIIAETDPEIVIGYHTYGYDNPYLWARTGLNRVKVNPKASRLMFCPAKFNDDNNWQSKGKGVKTIKQINFGGRIDIDVLFHVREHYKLKDNRLDTAAKAILNKGKYELPYRTMFSHYHEYIKAQFLKDHPYMNTENRKIEDILTEAQNKLDEIVKYNSVDTIITYELFEKLSIFTGYRELCNIVGINIQDVLNRGEQARGVSTIYNECKNKDILMNKINFDSNIEFTGARVFDPKLGLWDNVMCEDFASLYPSIMVSLNLCYSTLIPRERWSEVPEGKYNVITWVEDVSGIKREYRYVKAEIREGVLPALLKKLLSGRSKIKKEMETEKDPLIKNVLDKKQLAVKVCANSIYGLTGIGQEMGILPLKPLSCSVTATGRKFITAAEKYLQEKYNANVIYGDTDSIMFQLPGVTTGKQCISEGRRLAKEMSTLYPGIVRFEFEKSGKLLIMTKKKYMYWKFDSYEKTRDGNVNLNYGELLDLNSPFSMELKGNVLVRRDNFAWYKRVYKDLLFNILKGKGMKAAYQQMVDEIKKLIEGKVDVHDLVIYGAMGAYYKSKVFKTAVFKEGLQRRGRYLAPGERFGFVVVKNAKDKYMGDKMRLIEEYEESMVDSKESGEKLEIDIEYYLSLIAKKNMDQLWNGGYNNVFGPIINKMEGVRYDNILNGIERYDDEGVVRKMLGKEIKEAKLEEKIEVYQKLNKNSKEINRNSSAEQKKLKKGIETMRKNYLTGRNIFDIKLNLVVKTIYDAYCKGRFKEIIEKISDLLS